MPGAMTATTGVMTTGVMESFSDLEAALRAIC
jgi:hypothetical protein